MLIFVMKEKFIHCILANLKTLYSLLMKFCVFFNLFNLFDRDKLMKIFVGECKILVEL